MKSRKVDTVTNNEELVRLEIYEGRIPMGEAGEELLAMERATAMRMLAERNEARADRQAMLATPLLPALRRWWRHSRRLV